MNELADVDTDALQAALGAASGPKAVKRLLIAFTYADGVRVETLSERYDIPRATVYSWLDRFEHQSIAEAVVDESGPGQPSKLDVSQRERLPGDLLAEARPSVASIAFDSSVGYSVLLESKRQWIFVIEANFIRLFPDFSRFTRLSLRLQPRPKHSEI